MGVGACELFRLSGLAVNRINVAHESYLLQAPLLSGHLFNDRPLLSK